MKITAVAGILLCALIMPAFASSSPDRRAAPARKVPIIYTPEYDISVFGIDKLSNFDGQKYGKIYRYLLKEAGLTEGSFYRPEMISDAMLLRVHTPDYLNSLKRSKTIAQIVSLNSFAYVPMVVLQRLVLRPMRYATGGTLLGAELALRYGWAVNLSGGYHHAKANYGGGLCVYADVPIAARDYLNKHPGRSVLIVDLDAHQGNGTETIFRNNRRVHILDVYNGAVYPLDLEARRYIEFNYPVDPGTGDREYLTLVRRALSHAIAKTDPGLIIYVAGVDILAGDPLGDLNVSEDGVIERDEIVFRTAFARRIPVLMVLSGSYLKKSPLVIGRSIKNLLDNVVKDAPKNAGRAPARK